MAFTTPDLWDEFGAEVQVADPVFRDFGGVLPLHFAGVSLRPGAHLYADEDGLIVAQRDLLKS